MNVDFLIAGQGLAGSLLAWHLMERGQRVFVADRNEAVTSSRVAAGIVNPLSGRQLNLPAGVEAALDHARLTYREMENRFGCPLFHPLPIAVLFDGEKGAAKWNSRLQDPAQAPRYGALCRPLESLAPGVTSGGHGGIEIKGCGWLDVPGLLHAVREELSGQGLFAAARVCPGEMETHPSGIRWNGISSRGAIFCEGWRGADNPWFKWIPMNNARGDILTIHCPELREERRILSRKGWILPLGGGRFRAGSTYDHTFEDENPTPQGRHQVEEKICGILSLPYAVTGHQSAVRPIIHRSEPHMGRHPRHPRVFYFNGLGSKGALHGPSAALRFVEYLLDNRPLDASRDIAKFWPSQPDGQ